MKLNQLRAVTAVAEQGSLRAAARHIGMSQPALTRTIGELERELGATLFERGVRGMTPTPAGKVFIRRARVIASEARRAHEEVLQFLGGDEGHVEVCLSIVAHLALLPTALPLFQKRYARTRLHIVEGAFPAAEPRLRDGSMDFYIGPSPERKPSREFKVEKLFDNTRAVFARRGHPRAHARSLSELTDEVWATTGITNRAENEFTKLFARYKLPTPKATIQADSMLSLLTTLMSSDALAVTLRQYSEFPLTRGALKMIEVKEPLPAPPIVLIRRAALPLTPAADYLADMFRRAAANYLRS